MALAELEVFHSRQFSPTRRLALGQRNLPVDPPPGFGGVLLGGIAAVAAEELTDDDRASLAHLMNELERGQRIVQPRIRHRFQSDHHGLARTRALLVGSGEAIDFDFEGHGSPLQMTLAAVYAAGQLPRAVRPRLLAGIRAGLNWRGEVGPDLVAHLSGRAAASWSTVALVDPVEWALDLLGLDSSNDKRAIQRRFRQKLREAHPDHGGERTRAADRISDLTEARRILLG